MSKTLTKYAEVEIRKLCEQTSHKITLEDFNDLTKLNDLCAAVLDNSAEHNDVIDMPVRVGPYRIHKPTIGALEWFGEYAEKWFSDNGYLLDCALAYVLTLSDLPGDLWELEDKKTAYRRIKRWMRKLDITHEELQAQLISVLGVSDKDGQGKDKAGDAGKLVAMLCREYGHTVEYWLWEAPVSIITLFANDYISRIEAENDAARAAATGLNKPPMSDSKCRRIGEMRNFVRELRDKWQTKI